MADAREALIMQSLVTRLRTITTANGYNTNVQKVFGDEIPMGISLEEYELPAIFVINMKSNYQYQQSCVIVKTIYELQLIHNATVGDSIMSNFKRDIARAIHADSPAVKRTDAFREFEGKPTSARMVDNEPDLYMIDANRIYCFQWEFEYHAHATDL
jgi:hypothetical protein